MHTAEALQIQNCRNDIGLDTWLQIGQLFFFFLSFFFLSPLGFEFDANVFVMPMASSYPSLIIFRQGYFYAHPFDDMNLIAGQYQNRTEHYPTDISFIKDHDLPSFRVVSVTLHDLRFQFMC